MDKRGKMAIAAFTTRKTILIRRVSTMRLLPRHSCTSNSYKCRIAISSMTRMRMRIIIKGSKSEMTRMRTIWKARIKKTTRCKCRFTLT